MHIFLILITLCFLPWETELQILNITEITTENIDRDKRWHNSQVHMRQEDVFFGPVVAVIPPLRPRQENDVYAEVNNAPTPLDITLDQKSKLHKMHNLVLHWAKQPASTVTPPNYNSFCFLNIPSHKLYLLSFLSCVVFRLNYF